MVDPAPAGAVPDGAAPDGRSILIAVANLGPDARAYELPDGTVTTIEPFGLAWHALADEASAAA